MDVWDTATFDDELCSLLRRDAELIRAHVSTEKEIFLAYDYSDSPNRPLLRPSNPHHERFLAVQEDLGERMKTRAIRAWHYTRMTDNEVAALLRDGIHLSTQDTLRSRLDALIAAGHMGAELAERLIAASPLRGDQRQSRTGKFWFASHPMAVGNSGVRRLLRYWGGEVASFWTDDAELLESVERIGRARILEVAVPLAATQHAFNAAGAVLAAYARKLGCVESPHAFDLFTMEPLPASSIIRVNTDGEPAFASTGETYPLRFVDIDQTYWAELTGETD